MPSLSVIVPTLGRETEIDRLLASLLESSVRPHEVILVDQNGDARLEPIVAQYADRLNINHLKAGFRGAAKARNWGAQSATGEVFCFPDDDCEALTDTFANALATLERTKADAVFGRVADRENRDVVSVFAKKEGRLTLEAYADKFVEATVFIRQATFVRFPYDEMLGAGTFHGAEEGQDQVLRMLKAGVVMFYSPEITYYHPTKITSHHTKSEIRRVFTYRCGFARFCFKHGLYSKWANRLFKVTLYMVYLSLFNRKKARYYYAEWLALLAGVVVP